VETIIKNRMRESFDKCNMFMNNQHGFVKTSWIVKTLWSKHVDQEDPVRFPAGFCKVFHQTSWKKLNFLVGILQNKNSVCKQNVVYMIGNYRKQILRINDWFLTGARRCQMKLRRQTEKQRKYFIEYIAQM